MENEMRQQPIKTEEAVQNSQPEKDTAIDLHALLLKLMDRWWIIAIASVACALIFALYSAKMIPATYQATAKLYVVSNRDSVVNVSDLQLSNYLANDYMEVFKNWHVHEAVMQKLGLNYTYSQMGSMISVSNPANTRILSITATAESPELAQQLANTYADVAREFISIKMQTAEPTIFEEALLPAASVGPDRTRNALIGFLIGLVLSAGVIAVKFLMDDYIRTADDVEKYIHIPVLGVMMLQEDEKTEDDKASVKKRKAGKQNDNK